MKFGFKIVVSHTKNLLVAVQLWHCTFDMGQAPLNLKSVQARHGKVHSVSRGKLSYRHLLTTQQEPHPPPEGAPPDAPMERRRRGDCRAPDGRAGVDGALGQQPLQGAEVPPRVQGEPPLYSSRNAFQARSVLQFLGSRVTYF